MGFFRNLLAVSGSIALLWFPSEGFAQTTDSHVNPSVTGGLIPLPVIGKDRDRPNSDSDTECLTRGAKAANGTDAMPEEEREEHIARFLLQATFGFNQNDLQAVMDVGICEWIVSQYENFEHSDANDASSAIVAGLAYKGPETSESIHDRFWQRAGLSKNQLRERVAFALSQIVVVSGRNSLIEQTPAALEYYQDILAAEALGNYRDLLLYITYSPAMGTYLTYLGSKSPAPDENYAREIMQLFTIGTDILHPSGSPKLGPAGGATYANQDVTELAKVFTGFKMDGGQFGQPINDVPGSAGQPLVFDEKNHDKSQKNFLNCTIPANQDADEDIKQTLNCLMDHPNTAPFLSRQLIQRFVTSSPSAFYVIYVSNAFESGKYVLPNGDVIGTGQTGDLMATVAAVLMYPHARNIHETAHLQHPNFKDQPRSGFRSLNTRGKFAEPVIRLMNVARAFDVSEYRTTDSDGVPVSPFSTIERDLQQRPYFAPSVFNFYRPGFIPGANTESGSGTDRLTVPEFQIMDPSSVVNALNFKTNLFLRLLGEDVPNSCIVKVCADEAPAGTIPPTRKTFAPDFSAVEDYVGTRSEQTEELNPTEKLIRYVDLTLTGGTLSVANKARMRRILSAVPLTDVETRIRIAIYLAMTSEEAIVQSE